MPRLPSIISKAWHARDAAVITPARFNEWLDDGVPVVGESGARPMARTIRGPDPRPVPVRLSTHGCGKAGVCQLIGCRRRAGSGLCPTKRKGRGSKPRQSRRARKQPELAPRTKRLACIGRKSEVRKAPRQRTTPQLPGQTSRLLRRQTIELSGRHEANSAVTTVQNRCGTAGISPRCRRGRSNEMLGPTSHLLANC